MALSPAPTAERVYLDGSICEKTARRTIANLHEIHAADEHAPIEFIINSQGGVLVDGTAIYSELAAMSLRLGGTHHITTKVRGMCASVATVIYQAGDVRSGGALDIFVFHEQMFHFSGEWLSDAAQRVSDAMKWEDKFLDILMERATAPRNIIAALTGPKDRVLLMHEAVALGLADSVDGVLPAIKSVA